MAYNPVPVNFLSTQTLIVPMDSTYQNNGMYKAYGLIFRLLYENIINTNVSYKPIYVYWAINPNKTAITDIDFTATTKGYNTALTTGLHQYSGGPFIIQSEDLAYVKTLITTWNANNTPVVTIHELVNDVTIDTIAKLIRPPRISVEENNAGIPIAYLNAAGLPDYYVLSGAYAKAPVWTTNNISVLSDDDINNGAFFGATHGLTCQKLAYDYFVSPHTSEGTWIDMPDTLPNLDEFLRLGGVLHNMCASITALENNAHFLTTSGITSNNNGTTFFINTGEATNPLVQAVATTNPQALPGGSEETWLNSATTYKPLTNVMAYFIRNSVQYDFMVAGQYQGSDVSPGATGAGAIVYEGGHQYTNSSPYTGSQENMYAKFVLNSVFLSVSKPFIELTMSPNAIKAGVSNNLAFTVKNMGGAEAKNATISVNLLPGMNPSNYSIVPTSITGDLIVGFTLTWSNITLDGGEAITFNVNNYTPSAPGAYPITFSATYGDEIFATSQPYVLNSCSTLSVLPSNSPFLLVDKKVDGNSQTFIESSDSVVFTYTITNYGDQPAYNIQLVDSNLFDYFNFGLVNISPAAQSIDIVNKKIIFPTGLAGLSIPPLQNAPANVLTITVNATHKGNSVVPPDEVINTAHVNYYNNYPGDPTPNKTSPESNQAKTYIVLPDISAVKSLDKTNAAIDDIVKYKIDITNTGNTIIDQVKITDLIPYGTSYVSGSLNVTTANIPSPTIVANYIAAPSPGRIEVTVIGEFQPLQATPGTLTDLITVEFDVQVNSIPPNPIQNNATIDYIYKIGDQQTGTASENSNTVETNIASLQMIKSGPPAVKLGENLTYTISLTNNGKVPLTNVNLVDTIPTGTSYVSSSGATLISQAGQVITLQVASIPINAIVNVTITVKVNTLPPAPYTITNNIIAIFTVDGVEKPPVTDSETTAVVQGTIDVSKGTVGNIANAKVGDTVTYNIVVTNTGNVPVTLTTLTDVITQAANTSFQDNFTIGGSPLVPQPASLNNVILTTVAPLNVLDPQESITITYDVKIESLPLDKKVDDTVTILFNYPVGQGTEQGQGQDSYTVNIQTPDISVDKAVDKANAAVGDILTYTVEITNTGTVNLESITFTDLIPIGTSYVANSLNATTNIVPAPSISKQYVALPNPKVEVIVTGTIKPLTDKVTITFQVKVESITQNPIENQGSVLYTYRIDPNESPRTGTKDSDIVETKVASLLVDKTAPTLVELGKNLTYTITLTNNGEVPLTNVKLVDTLPSGTSYVSVSGANFVSLVGQVLTLQVNSIPISGTVNINITVTVNTLPAAPYTITNNISAIFTVDGVEKPPVTDSATTDVIEGSIDVAKGTVGNINYAKVGDTVIYSVVVTNTGNVPVNLTNLADVIQPVIYTNPTSTNLSLNITLQPGQSTTITYDVDSTALPPNKKIDNTVTVDFNYQVGQETKTGQQQDTFTLNIEEIKVSLTKAVNKAYAEPGEELAYTFTIKNDSSVPITNVYLFDALPVNTSFVTGSFSLNASQNPTIFPGSLVGTIPKNSQVVVSFKVKVNESLTSSVIISDTGSVTYNYKVDPTKPDQPGGPATSNTVTTTVEIAEIEIIKAVSDDYAEVGDVVTYTLTAKNIGTVDAYDVVVTDILPPELQFVAGTLVITPQQVGDTVTGTDPSYVKIDILRANPNVATIQFDAKVISRPESAKVENIAYGSFKYSLDPQLPPTLSKTDIPSNPVTTTIEEIEVVLLKTTDSNYVEVGQNLTYTVQITNKSTVPVSIKFTDTLPTGTQYVTGSFTLITGTATIVNNTDPNSTLIYVDITGMQPQSSVIFSYKIKVLTLPPSGEITNAAKAVPSYSLFPGGPIRVGDPVTDEVTTEVKLIKIDAIKSVEESIATIGDILHYTVRIINSGNVTAENVVFSDNVPDGTEFVEGSLTVNGAAPIPLNATPNDGVEIGNINPGEIVTIKFNVKVIAIPNPPNEPKVENVALVTFDVELDGVLQPRDPVTSNPVETKLVKVQLEAIKTVNKESANIGDTLTYTVVIKNTGDVTINNVIFNDVIPEGTILTGSQPVQNVNLGSIEPGKAKTVIFTVKIVSKPCPPKLINKAKINGIYFIERERKIQIESNEVVTYVGIAIFKQISVDEKLTIPEVKPDAEDILEVIADVEITYTNVIKTPIVTSYEGQHLTGWKLIVEGKLKQKVVYIADEKTQSVHAAEFDVPFSTFLVLPKDYEKCQKINVVGVIEDVFYTLVDKRTIFKNVTLMIQGKTGC